jgi:glycerol transport system ATP-binding protein
MYDGRVVQIGTPQELFERPGHTFVGYFIGSPGMNLFDAQIDGTTARVGDATVQLDGSYSATGKTQLGVRPEFIRLSSGTEGIPATIRRIEDVGRHKIVRLDVGGREISAVAGEGEAISADTNRITFAPGGINVYADDWRVSPQGGVA